MQFEDLARFRYSDSCTYCTYFFQTIRILDYQGNALELVAYTPKYVMLEGGRNVDLKGHFRF